ncbi:hypothetical protein WBJ53_20625 [Spirosoma sp. SC4-14]|uniref:hypothetical protein n=1 Tax=Spirosoma sp. SC4-14 TaxID=3128900 RepID=UPI0030CF125C
MNNQFDHIRLAITQRYIELAESGYVDNKCLERARQVADALKHAAKPLKSESVLLKIEK